MKNIRNAWEGLALFPKFDLRMKLSLLFFLVILFQIRADSGYAQKTKISLDMEAVTVLEVIKEIEEVTEFRFFYKKKELDADRIITIRARRKNIANVLQTLFKNTLISYEIVDKQIILTKSEVSHETKVFPRKQNIKNKKDQQQVEVSGKITDHNGEPLAGVNVIVKGTSRGTMSNPNGQYAISVHEDDVLTFSFIGFRTVEESVSNRSTINIQLMEDVTTLEGVEVNAGYYTVKERERTGNISRVTAEDIEKQPVPNPLQALQGRMSGVEIVQQSGVPGASMRIQIRGQNSLRTNEGNFPLYIIDGVPISSTPSGSYGNLLNRIGIDPLNTLNLSNIESIEILKDADATAIYGSRGANGVVLITTKEGEKEKKTSVEMNIQSGIGKVSNTMKLLNTKQYLDMRNEAFTNDGITPTISNAPDLLMWEQNRYVDWQKKLIGGTAYITNLQANISGGNEQTSFLFGGGYRKETTVFPGDFDYNKIMGNFSLNHSSTDKKFQINFSINYGEDKNHLFNGSIIEDALRLPPNSPILYNDDGNINWELDSNGNPTFDNPIAQLMNKQDITSNNLITNLALSYKLRRGLTLKTSLGYTDFRQEETIITPRDAFNPTIREFIDPSTLQLNHTNKSWIIEPQLIYKDTLGNSRLDILIGMTWQSSTSSKIGIIARGYTSEEQLGNLGAASMVSVAEDSQREYRYNAIFGRIGYSWKKKYFLNLTGRRDGSSRFGPDKRFANFWAIGGAWIFSEESFLGEKTSFLSFGKLRGSYGTTGSDQIGDYGYLTTYNSLTTPFNYRGEGGLIPTRLANPEYSWEINKKLEAAIELGFFHDLVLLSASWYRNRSSSQLVGYPLPNITGFNSVQFNLPATVQNTGWELEMTSKNIVSKNFNWTSYFNWTIPQNKLIEFPNIEGTSYANRYEVGQPLYIRKLYQFDGINPETGLYQVLDANEDERYDQEDRIMIKNLGRQYFGGFQNSFQYRGWQLSFLLEFVKQKGYDYRSLFGVPGFNPGGLGGNQPVDVLKRWQESGDITDIQKFTQSFSGNSPVTRMKSSDLNITDASFIRLKNISLSYQIPYKWLERTKITGCSLFIRAQNLFTWSNYKGLNPESPNTTIDLPVLKMVTGGVQLQF